MGINIFVTQFNQSEIGRTWRAWINWNNKDLSYVPPLGSDVSIYIISLGQAHRESNDIRIGIGALGTHEDPFSGR